MMEKYFTTSSDEIKRGDKFTVELSHEKRTFWEWITRKPKTEKPLIEYVVRDIY